MLSPVFRQSQASESSALTPRQEHQQRREISHRDVSILVPSLPLHIILVHNPVRIMHPLAAPQTVLSDVVIVLIDIPLRLLRRKCRLGGDFSGLRLHVCPPAGHPATKPVWKRDGTELTSIMCAHTIAQSCFRSRAVIG